MKKVIKRKPRSFDVPKECAFCKENKNPDFLDYEALKRFTTERGKIFSRSRSGICTKHQRKFTREVKRARILALLPFLVQAE